MTGFDQPLDPNRYGDGEPSEFGLPEGYQSPDDYRPKAPPMDKPIIGTGKA